LSPAQTISVDRSSPVPLYFQLALYFEAAIRSGALLPGVRLENEVQLAQELGLSRPTVRAAFLYLADKGLVERKRGYGTVVTKEKINRDVELTSLMTTWRAPERRRPPRFCATRSRTPTRPLPMRCYSPRATWWYRWNASGSLMANLLRCCTTTCLRLWCT
jgi:DNA-binding GntR family transcriptional regulator